MKLENSRSCPHLQKYASNPALPAEASTQNGANNSHPLGRRFSKELVHANSLINLNAKEIALSTIGQPTQLATAQNIPAADHSGYTSHQNSPFSPIEEHKMPRPVFHNKESLASHPFGQRLSKDLERTDSVVSLDAEDIVISNITGQPTLLVQTSQNVQISNNLGEAPNLNSPFSPAAELSHEMPFPNAQPKKESLTFHPFGQAFSKELERPDSVLSSDGEDIIISITGQPTLLVQTLQKVVPASQNVQLPGSSRDASNLSSPLSPTEEQLPFQNVLKGTTTVLSRGGSVSSPEMPPPNVLSPFTGTIAVVSRGGSISSPNLETPKAAAQARFQSIPKTPHDTLSPTSQEIERKVANLSIDTSAAVKPLGPKSLKRSPAANEPLSSLASLTSLASPISKS